MRGVRRNLLAIALAMAASGCLGTVVRTPARGGQEIGTTMPHILAAPFRIDAHTCQNGLATVTTFVPLWGVAVGILTLGILVPKTTFYTCVEA